MILSNPNGKWQEMDWLKVYKDRIEQTISDEKIEFDNQMGSCPSNAWTNRSTDKQPWLHPSIEVFNHMDCTGEATGNGEFNWLANQICITMS